jgi:hypothetical protein
MTTITTFLPIPEAAFEKITYLTFGIFTILPFAC